MRARPMPCLLIGMLVVLAALAMGRAGPAAAQNAPSAVPGDLTPALSRLATENFNDIEAAIVALAATGSERAAPILQALNDGRLVYRAADRAVFIRDGDGKVIDARNGEVLAQEPSGLRPVRLNNRIRRALEAALGSLTLLAPDPAKRASAAEAVFKSRDPAALASLDAALSRELDPAVRKAMREARAAVILVKPEAGERDKIEAVETIGARGDRDALALLSAARSDANPIVRMSAESAATGIERRLAILSAVQNVWYGLSAGSVLLLAAIGLAITFGVMGIINMAHGEMVMLGAYTTFVVQETIRTSFPGLFDWSLAIALPLAFVVAGGVGVAIERGIIRFLYGRPLETLLATWGVSLILQQAVRSYFGPTNREVGAPSFMAGNFDLFGMTITSGRAWIVLFGFSVFAALLFVMKATSFGLKMRAVTQNRRMAAAMGIRTPWVDALTFGLGSGIAGIAGVALSQINNVSPNLGQLYIIDSFMVVVFGGVGNLWGTLVAAMTLGVANKVLEPYAGAVLGKILLLVFIILFIQRRPRGLFALRGRAVDA